MAQTIKLDKKEIDLNINYHKNNESLGIIWPDMDIPKTAFENIKKEINFVLTTLKRSWEGTYIFLCQDNAAFLYGLYKGEDSGIYLVKSFMDSIILTVRFKKIMIMQN